MGRLVCLPKFLGVVSLIAGAALAHAQTELVPTASTAVTTTGETGVTAPGAPDTEVALTEAQRCERSLAEVHEEGLARSLAQVRSSEQFNEQALDAMIRSGAVTDELGVRRVRAKLMIGVELLKLGLFHEAIYQAFQARYKSSDEIADALRGFAHISTASEQGLLISEVTERVLQYIPDIDASNVNRLKETAAFLGMSGSQMETFRAKWKVYDEDDQFAEILQGGILAILTSGNADMIKSVQERSGWLKRKYNGWKVIQVPARPVAIDPTMTVRQVQVEDRGYYDDAELANYLRESSTAARQFFLSVRSNVLTRAQIILAIENRDAWSLKASLIADLKRELAWRNALYEKFRAFADLKRAQREADLARARLENRATFDQRQVQQAVGQMRQLPTVAEVLAKATTILEETHVLVDSKDYVNIVLSITSNATKLIGNGPATLAFVKSAVTYGNLIGLVPDHANKLQRELRALAERAKGRDGEAALQRVRELVATTPQFEGKTLEEINLILLQLNGNLEVAREELDELYARKF